jgi:hypothetical protein
MNANTSTEEYRGKMLLARHPRFIWRATMLASGQDIMEILADATGVKRGSTFLSHRILSRRPEADTNDSSGVLTP